MTTAAPSTRDTILVVARQRFAERGFSGTSLADIADEVGIRPPSLFHHFPSKVALYRAVLLDAFDDWFALMDETMAAEPAEGWPQVERVIRTAFRFFVERPDFVRLARWEALEGGPVLVAGARHRAAAAVRAGRRLPGAEMDAGTHPALRRPPPGDHRLRRGALVPLRRARSWARCSARTRPARAALEVEQEHILDLFRHALEPRRLRSP